MEKSLSRSRRQRVGTPAGRRGVQPGAPSRRSRAPTAFRPAWHQRPQSWEADRWPGSPRGGRAPWPPSQGKSRGSRRVKIRAHTGRGARGARGDAELGPGTSSRCAAAPGRFKSSGSQAQPPAPIPLPSTSGGWTGPVPVDSPSSLPPRDLGARGRSSSSLSPFKKIKQKVRSFSMHYFETWFPYLQNEDRNINTYK